MSKLCAILAALFIVLLLPWVQLISLIHLVAILIIFLMPSQVLKRFSLFFWKKLLKWLASLFLSKLSMYFLYVLTLFTSSYLFNVFLVQHIFLWSLFFVSVDLRRPLVTQALFCNLLFLFDTLWRGAQKFISCSIFIRNDSNDNPELLRITCSFVAQSIPSTCAFIRFLLFSILLKSLNICIFSLSICLVWNSVNRN